MLSFLLLSALFAASPVSAPPVDHRAIEVPLAWDELLQDLVRRERQGPVVAARLIGEAGVVMHEAALPALAGEPTLAGRLAALGSLPSPPKEVAFDERLALNAAAARMLRTRMRERGADVDRAIDALEQRVVSESAASVIVALASAEHGRNVADAILAWASTDGRDALPECKHETSKEPGHWRPTPPAFRQKPLQPCWGNLRPMVLSSRDACALPAPTPYSESEDAAFHAEAMEVLRVVEAQDLARQEIALFWSDDPGATGTPPAHWLAILDQVASERGLALGAFLRARAALGIALHDAAIACWRDKYVHDYVRPVTYIQAHVKPSWVPFLATPPFPEYPSGHSVLSGAAARVLDVCLGEAPFVDRTRGARGHASRRYASFAAAAEEAAISRVYAGIHFRPACERGLVQGRCVGDQVIERLRLRAEDAP